MNKKTCALVLASAVHPAFGLRFNQYPGCDDLCSEEFWAGAGANDVVAALAREPATVSYRGHVLQLAVSSGANADAIEALLRAGAPPNVRQDTGDRRYVLQDAVLLGTEARSDRWGDDDDRGRVAREEAAQRSTGIVSALLAAGADPPGRGRVGSEGRGPGKTLRKRRCPRAAAVTPGPAAALWQALHPGILEERGPRAGPGGSNASRARPGPVVTRRHPGTSSGGTSNAKSARKMSPR